MLDDNKIIDLYVQRDESAISETAEKYGAYCNKIAYNILLDSFDSEECVNDTYMRTWNSVPPTIPRVFSAFLAKITRNIAIDKYKSKSAAKRSAYTESLEELCECVGEGDISDRLDAAAIGAAISRFLLGESEISRRIFVRRYFFEDSISEIARAHFMSEGNVKTTLHRTRKRLKEFLEKEDVYV